MADEEKPRVIKQTGGLGGGRLECDGTDHFWVVEEYEKFNCPPEVNVGPCPGGILGDPKKCRGRGLLNIHVLEQRRKNLAGK